MLEAAGIAVTTGVLGKEARLSHGGHISRITRGRPWLTLKLAVSADGMIGKRAGERMLITGRATFERVQGLRAEHDAVLIGIGTVEVDDPKLTLRYPASEPSHPIRVVLDTKARIGLATNLVQSARETPLWVFVGEDADPAKVAALEAAGVVVLKAPKGTGGLDFAAVAAALAEKGLTRILVEGGSCIASTMVNAGLADEVLLFRADVVVGPDGVRALAGGALSAIERSPRFRLVEDVMVGDDRLRRYLKAT
jgi:diaminohydroxyphosphoribosylaminopyrimidine deaminase/5-amino-6-(5-phosphoribosylamino)uracil reductase